MGGGGGEESSESLVAGREKWERSARLRVASRGASAERVRGLQTDSRGAAAVPAWRGHRAAARRADEAERERRLLLQGRLDPAALAASDNPAPALALRLSQLSRWLTDDPARTQEAKRRFNRQQRGQAQRAGRQQQQQQQHQLEDQQQQQAEEGDSWEMGPSCDAPSRQLSATEEPPDGGERRKSRQQGRADSGAGDEEDSCFTQADYERLKYEAPLVKQLRSLETLDEMYSLAEEIVGPLRPVRAAKTAKGAF
ncbi:probable serine/threonine-protein kinase irlF [Schistocerca serialis cubense]|uniref:probable serine/threonine-protein kinase irlF n=1 Tax=Schistocerca serialis cubense TaxID=2023355 RepID=UPI00214E75A1|nr:probable serine/threonine-protein kinase irlF [Schistocerca serialis cubense]